MQGTEQTPKAPLGNNARPLQQLHHRTVRTNINFPNAKNQYCPTMYKDMQYRGELTFSLLFFVSYLKLNCNSLIFKLI